MYKRHVAHARTLACRVEVTLRTAGGAGARVALQDLAVGQAVRGRVKRVERYGIFVEVRDSSQRVSASACLCQYAGALVVRRGLLGSAPITAYLKVLHI